MAEAKARQAEREKERAARKTQKPATSEITLENAATPGLPPPLSASNPAATPAAKGSDTPGDASDPTTPASRDDIISSEAQHLLADHVDLERARAQTQLGKR